MRLDRRQLVVVRSCIQTEAADILAQAHPVGSTNKWRSLHQEHLLEQDSRLPEAHIQKAMGHLDIRMDWVHIPA